MSAAAVTQTQWQCGRAFAAQKRVRSRRRGGGSRCVVYPFDPSGSGIGPALVSPSSKASAQRPKPGWK